MAGIAAVIAAILLAKSLLKSGGNNSTKAVPDFGVGMNSAQQAGQILAKAENQGFTLTGNGEDCPSGIDRRQAQAPAGTIIAQDPPANAYKKPGPITYCVSLGPQLGAVPNKAVLNGMNEDPAEGLAHRGQVQPGRRGRRDPAGERHRCRSGNIIDVFDQSAGTRSPSPARRTST